jgi:hypothetical protein
VALPPLGELTEDQVGYIVWGALAVFVAIPEVLAAVGKELVPWPGFTRTAVYLQARSPRITMVFLALFAILTVHIVWYPWPSR